MVHLRNWTQNIRRPILSTFNNMKEARNYLIGLHYDQDVTFHVCPEQQNTEFVYVGDEWSYSLSLDKKPVRQTNPKEKFERLFNGF